MEVIAITAFLYTVTSADNQRSIAVLSPDAIITLAATTAYGDKFCVNVKNMNIAASIKIRAGSKFDGWTNEVELYPQTIAHVTLKDGAWSLKDSCPQQS